MKIYFKNNGLEDYRESDLSFVKNNVGNVIEAFFEGSTENTRATIIIEWSNGETTNELPMQRTLNNSFYFYITKLLYSGITRFTIRLKDIETNEVVNTGIIVINILEAVDPSDATISRLEYEQLLRDLQDAINRLVDLEDYINNFDNSVLPELNQEIATLQNQITQNIEVINGILTTISTLETKADATSRYKQLANDIQELAVYVNNELSKIGNLNNLTTDNKSNLVAAINEINSTLNSTLNQLTTQLNSLEEYVNGQLEQFSDRINTVEENVDGYDERIENINKLIPNQANIGNQLADKDYVNSSINSVSAFPIVKDALGNPFATYAELSQATEYYSGGERRTPTRNDYTTVQSDETHGNATTRYVYTKNDYWQFQYIVNNSPFTSNQIAAINSGITSSKVEEINDNASAIESLENGKLDKVSTTAARARVYGVRNDGTQIMYDVSQLNISGSVVRRDGLNINIGTATDGSHATNKEYVDNALNNKLDKITTTGTTRAYVVNTNGSQGAVRITQDVVATTLMARDTNGRSKIQTPVDNLEIANKQYVDTSIANQNSMNFEVEFDDGTTESIDFIIK